MLREVGAGGFIRSILAVLYRHLGFFWFVCLFVVFGGLVCRSDPCALPGVNPGVVAGTPGVLFIGVHSAAGLPPMDRDGLADPYAKVKVVQAGVTGTGGGVGKLKRLFQTQIVDNTLDPVWDDAASCSDQHAGSWRCRPYQPVA